MKMIPDFNNVLLVFSFFCGNLLINAYKCRFMSIRYGILLGFLLLVVAGIYIALVNYFALNVPVVDDYDFIRATYLLQSEPMSFFRKT